jgi:hypothetical protein
VTQGKSDGEETEEAAALDQGSRFPLPVVRDCTDMWSGIACTRVPDLKTGKLGPRLLPGVTITVT